ncbi:MAG TPA: VCBS repeat-containing protein [Polyangiaceae bacterium]
MAIVVAGALAACGDSGSDVFDGGGDASFADANDGGGNGGDASVDGFGFGDGGGGCAVGQACGDGGVCTGNDVCCAASSACGTACCGSGEVCSFQKCVSPGGTCFDSTDCPQGQYCDYSLGDDDAGTLEAGCTGGATQKNGRCLPTPPLCAPDAGTPDSGALTCLEQCDYHGAGTFNPTLKYAWGGQLVSPFATDVMMAPIVIELDDDDCDGKVTEKDIPEIVFSTFASGQYHGPGTVHAISIVGGVVVDKWSYPGVVDPGKQIAGGDIDGKPGNEIVICGTDGYVHALHGDGTPFWTSSAPEACVMPSIADLDGDGFAEVIVEGGILDGATGTLKHAFSTPLDSSFVISDLDDDGQLDVVTAARGYHADGTLFVDTGLGSGNSFANTADWKSPWPAVADFEGKGLPEVVVIDNLAHTLFVWRYDAQAANKFDVVRAPVDINSKFATNTCAVGSWGNTHGGGPPTVADFNGDGVPDVGTAGGIGYVVFDGKSLVNPAVTGPNTILWAAATNDCSSASTGSSVFDFNGDGKAEVVYSDETHLRIYDGPTGNVLFSTCNTTATLIEYPIIADVDNDGHADIVVVSNAYAKGSIQCNDGQNVAQAGVRIFGDPDEAWVRTRRVWNEHAYHITNVNEDGTIPKSELANWTQPGLNNFRQNKQPGSEFAAPDAVVSLRPVCTSPYELVATVTNIGEAALPAGIDVGFYEGAPPTGTLLGKAKTTQVLYSAQSENVVLTLANPPAGVTDGSQPLYAVVDDTNVAHPSWHECRTDNNTSATTTGSCGVVH